MGLDYTVAVGYGFYLEHENERNFLERLEREDYEIDGYPHASLLEELGYSELMLDLNHSDPPHAAWAVVAKGSYKSVYSRDDVGNSMLSFEVSALAQKQLDELRAQLFSQNEEKLPPIGDFMMVSCW